MNEMKFEEKKLKSIIDEYIIYLEDLNLEYNNIYKLYKNPDQAEERKIFLDNKINIIERNINKPYFARIDFKNKKDNITDICYIGKVGVTNYDNEIITVDWRAPISSLYYDSNVGNTKYKVEDKYIHGELLLKRQYTIENKQLISFQDVDTVSNDDLLKPYLTVSSDARLKNIVATIQGEQNDIIRSKISDNIIIQGVAGSGKTTVALHRIAYLVYNYRDVIKDNQYMVIGPNKFFINYISSVLPDLDVQNVKQYSLNELLEHYTGQQYNVLNGYTSTVKQKASLDFKKIIDSYFEDYIENVMKEKYISVKDFTLIDSKYLQEIWLQIDKKRYSIINERIDRCILLLEKYLNDNETNIISMVNKFYDKKLDQKQDLKTIRKDRAFVLQELNKNKASILKNFFKKILQNPTSVYNEISKQYKLNTPIAKNNIYFEDITPLLYINYKIYGSKKYDVLKHIVIDEAQDYNEFTFYTLKKIFKNSTFSIYGDLAQCLNPEYGLNSWDKIKTKVFHNKIEIKYLSKSYRTTIEIMEQANKINKHLNLPQATAVIRHGDKVTYEKTKDLVTSIEKSISMMRSQNFKSIAIIVKDNKELSLIQKQLKDKINIQIIDENNIKESNGVYIVTSTLAKGLEFDGVIITNVNESNYHSNNDLDMKLLYVSMTRAMHNLIILYNESLPNALKV